eukprot:gene11723-101_t
MRRRREEKIEKETEERMKKSGEEGRIEWKTLKNWDERR